MKARWVVRLSAAVAATAAWLGAERSAQAWGLNAGVDGGLASRSGFGVGPTVGAHAELRLFKGLQVGGYFSYYSLDPKESPSDAQAHTGFASLGGRVRYLHPVLPWLRPFASLGVGYTMVEYPAYNVAPKGLVNPSVSQQLGKLEAREGNFIEIPVGLGVAMSPARATDIELGFTWRQGTSFKGAAYEGEGSYSKPEGGFTLTAGVSLFF